jgi:hypothetical protein
MSAPALYDDPKVTAIPIKNIDIPFVDLMKIKNDHVKMLPSMCIPFSGIHNNAGLPHSSYIRKPLLHRLEAAAQNFNLMYNEKKTEKSKIVFMVFEGLRTNEDCENAEMPFMINSHKATGGVVSFRVYDETYEEFVDMGDMLDLTFSNMLTHEQKRNREMLLYSCGIAGLVNYPLEWWTFCFGTQYYSYQTSNEFAIFSQIEKNSQIIKND